MLNKIKPFLSRKYYQIVANILKVVIDNSGYFNR